jgi:hypothetical protein
MQKSRKLVLVSMYMNDSGELGHQVSLRLEETGPGTMTGEVEIDPNTCSLDLWGDRGACTRIAVPTQQAGATRMRTLDPKGLGRIHWQLHLPALPDLRIHLIEFPRAKLWYLSLPSERGSRVVPLFDPELFALDTRKSETAEQPCA